MMQTYDELRNMKIGIFGIQGSGKTYFSKNIIRLFKKPMAYVVHAHDYTDIKKLYTANRREVSLAEFVQAAIKLGKAKKIDLIVIDEADLYFQWNYDLDDDLNDLILNHRHYNLALMFISRRPQDVPTKIVESCHHLYIFAVEGDNVFKKLDNIRKGLSDQVKQLTYKKYDYVHKKIGEEPEICQAIR